MSHSKDVDHGPCPPILGPDVEDPDDPPMVGTAVIEMTVLGDVVPCVIVAGLGMHFNPAGEVGNEHAMLTSAGSVAPNGVRPKSI
jgi:hypothetical protein